MSVPTRRSDGRHLCAVALLTLVGALFGSCGTDGEDTTSESQRGQAEVAPPDSGWVGHVEETNAFAAVVAGGNEAVAYVCDGDAGIADWFAGDTDADSSFVLTSSSGATIDGHQTDGRMVGRVDLGDEGSHAFALVPAEGDAGLFRVEDPEADRAGVSAGWIVGNDGAQRGSLRIRGTTRTVPERPTSALTVGGTDYSVVFYAVPARLTPAAPSPLPVAYPNEDKSPSK